MSELWKPVVGWEGYYEVSDQGGVRRDGRRVKPWDGTSGHLYVSLSRHGQITKRPVHQLVLESFVGPRPADADTCHIDGNPLNNAATNLRWGSRLSNIEDLRRHTGRTPHASLTSDQACAIRVLYATGEHSRQELAKRYGVSAYTIYDVLRHRTWSIAGGPKFAAVRKGHGARLVEVGS